MPQVFQDWEEAAAASVFEKAVSEPYKIKYKGKDLEVEIIKPLRGDGWITKARSGFQLFDVRLDPSDIDAVKRWYRYG